MFHRVFRAVAVAPEHRTSRGGSPKKRSSGSTWQGSRCDRSIRTGEFRKEIQVEDVGTTLNLNPGTGQLAAAAVAPASRLGCSSWGGTPMRWKRSRERCMGTFTMTSQAKRKDQVGWRGAFDKRLKPWSCSMRQRRGLRPKIR